MPDANSEDSSSTDICCCVNFNPLANLDDFIAPRRLLWVVFGVSAFVAVCDVRVEINKAGVDPRSGKRWARFIFRLRATLIPDTDRKAI